ncbi:MAG TPA: VWA domain-containing protein, partial [Pirellulaceae bacterium]|nr:VWA domain-containing protein [Pirellulaceae bacterium]
MNLLNQALAWGALAASIPLILHILNRSRFRRIEWGAMHLLESVVKVNYKRFRFEQLILLLVRCAIPALLALCLARPVLTGSQKLAGDAPVSLVILLDTSYSMDATSAGVPHFSKAVDAAAAIVDATSRGSEVAVIRTGGGPTPLFDQPIFDSAAVVRRLRTLQAGYGASDMQQALDAGLATLAGMSHARRELIVISDFQPADWTSTTSASDSIRQQVDAMTVKPELTLLQVGEEVVGNVSIESLEFSTRPLGAGQQLAIRANLRNHGDTSAENARVVLKLDGAEHSVSQVVLAGNTSTQTLFPCSFESAGSHVIEVQVAVNDPLQTDNHFAAAVTILDEINVLLVDGAPSTQALQGETDFLAVALTPYSFARLKLADLVKTQAVSADGFKPELLASQRVVVLANVPRLKDEQ